ncbi:TMEM175 family protein [Nodosilinea nodulosa]|uniref:TMEM175 family protein n=1 Tax=Nodosilinea nodulosa TaxID=416001 RepID=UPI0002EFCBC8|nr:TMEM175 family protein [Nodosilinea nodulosa]
MKRDKLGLDRIIFFSDAVFAIAITLLSINLQLPRYAAQDGISDDLLHMLPEYQSYAISFVVIGLYWVSHHYYFRFIRRYDYTFVAINFGLLMCIASLPFATSVLNSYGDHRSAVAFYALCMAATGLMKTLLWHYAAHNSRLISSRLSAQRVRRLTRQAAIPPLVFLASIAITLFNPMLAKLSWASIALIFA